jgi:hypothetical protein
VAAPAREADCRALSGDSPSGGLSTRNGGGCTPAEGGPMPTRSPLTGGRLLCRLSGGESGLAPPRGGVSSPPGGEDVAAGSYLRARHPRVGGGAGRERAGHDVLSSRKVPFDLLPTGTGSLRPRQAHRPVTDRARQAPRSRSPGRPAGRRASFYGVVEGPNTWAPRKMSAPVPGLDHGRLPRRPGFCSEAGPPLGW